MAKNTNDSKDIRAARELAKSILRRAEWFEAQAEVALVRAAELRAQVETMTETFGL